MRHSARVRNTILMTFLLTLVTGGTPVVVTAQAPPSYPPAELEKLVSKIALYPDPLVAQILAGATYPDQIPDAAKWADEHHYLRGDDLARAITEDHLPWDASVQALLPFPSVLEMMASDMNWTSELGNAFLAQQQDVMEAVQRDRKKARDYGYLRTNAQVVVAGGPISPSCRRIRLSSAFRFTIRESCFSLPGQDFSWAAPSASALAYRWASRLPLGDGAIRTSSGIGTRWSWAARIGEGPGPIAGPTRILTTDSNVGMGRAARKNMNASRAMRASAGRHARVTREPKSVMAEVTNTASRRKVIGHRFSAVSKNTVRCAVRLTTDN